MHYSTQEMKRYLMATVIFVACPLLFLAINPTAIKHYGEFSSFFWTYLTKHQVVAPNAIGVLSDFLIFHLIFFAVYPKRRVTSDRLLKLLDSSVSLLRGRHLIDFTDTEWLNIRVYLVKLFFAPLMILFVTSLFRDLADNGHSLLLNLSESKFYFMTFALVLMSCMFIIDVSCFCLGYFTESKRLDNVIRSVDPTVSGWLVCLICYPPFSANMHNIFGNMYEIGAIMPDPYMTFVLTVVGLSLICVYTKASVDLLFKASNLTYRGLVTSGTYSIVRHPAYTSKVLTWTILTLPFVAKNPWLIFTILAWSTIYILRALTEERHLLIADREKYFTYMKRVPYRFIPGVI